MRMRTLAAMAAVLAAGGPAALPAPVGATTALTTPAITVVATGLDNPRGLLVAPDGTVLVAEAGRQGVSPCLPPSPGTLYQPACLSSTGAVTAIRGGRQFRVVEGLASVGPPTGVGSSGPHDLALTSAGLLVTMGFANNPDRRAQLGPGAAELGTVVAVDWSGQRRVVADLAAHEGAHNPDGLPGEEGEWSNPYAMLVDGRDVVVADAGANTVVRAALGGTVTTEQVFPNRPGGSNPSMQPVPDAIVEGPDGAWYVGELTGSPYPKGGARVYRMVPGGAPEVYADGFTTVIDLAFDGQGRLLVLEMFRNGLLSGDPTGRLVRLEPDGSRTTVASEGLVHPTSVAVGPDGAIYVTSNTLTVGLGQVLKITGA